ncbi:hypothetical protein NQZ79_g784 [Umbelopsis isabellina]|nr:hypothetical protein NQZ79_g784 [Umbelopsis isabellina]
MTASHPLLDQPAPCSITLKNQRNENVNLEKYVGNKRPVVLFFYPRDEGPVCTKEVCAFRDSYDIFTKHGAILIGVSSSDVDSHSNFASKNRLQFDILADPRSELRKMYQVPKSGLGLVPGMIYYP